jgi:hypothetical protein
MSATAPKPSRFWGTTPRRIKWFVGVLFVLLIGAVFAIAVLLFRDFIWKFNATYFAGEAGRGDAKMYYARGFPRLLELATFDDSHAVDAGPIPAHFEMRPAGRRQDGFDVYFIYVSSLEGSAERIPGESYVKEFNHQMRVIIANPDWFDSHGERLPDSPGTNRPPFKRVPE